MRSSVESAQVVQQNPYIWWTMCSFWLFTFLLMPLHEDNVKYRRIILCQIKKVLVIFCATCIRCLTKQALSVGIGRAQVITRTSSDEKIKRAPFINLKDRINPMSVSSRLQMCTEILFNNRKQTKGWKKWFCNRTCFFVMFLTSFT